MPQQRLDWLDAAKGLGILLVVLGHTAIPPALFVYIFSFHLPLFFFISGYLFKTEKYSSFPELLRYSGKKLILTYFIFGLAIYFYWLGYGHFLAEDLAKANPYQPLLDLLYASSHLKDIFTPLWFLPCLFLVQLIFFIFSQKIKPGPLLALSFFLSLLSVLFLTQTGFNLPWSLDVALVGLFFFNLGNALKTYWPKIKISFLQLIFLFTTTLLLSLVFIFFNDRVDMRTNSYGNFGLFLFSAGLGITIICSLAKLWPTNLLQWLGQNSLIIFAFHQVFLGLGKKALTTFFPQIDIAAWGQNNLLIGLGLSLFAIFCLFLLIQLFKFTKKKLAASF